MSEETEQREKVRVRAFQIGVEPDDSGHFMRAVLLPPDGRAQDGEPPIVLATIRHMIFREPGVPQAFNVLLKTIAGAMVARHLPDEAENMQVTQEPWPDHE